MASASPPERNPFSRPTSSHVPSPSTTGPVIQNRSRSASLEQLTKYPYLYEAAIKRPAVYESPYAVGGGFTQAWLPNPATAPPRHVRTTSISQEYLMKRTPSQQAHVKAHVRHVSTDKATSQQRKQRETQNRQLESKQRALMPPPIPPSASLSLENQQTLPQMHHNQSFHPELYHQQQTYTRPPAFPEFHSPYDPPSHTYSNLLHQDHGSFPSSHSFQPPGLQFQSPRDFQLQMQRDTQQGKEPGGYEAFMREMQEVGNVHPHSHGSQDGPEHGSPLRQGMRAAGGEMLPMMRDQY
ncbi:hypothetical protein MMC19_001949 [Ptychographa xylographoides]|nr:hypothetical protein [Ptychographa xylographoides]